MKAMQFKEEQNVILSKDFFDDDEDIECVEEKTYYDLCLWRRNTGVTRLGEYYCNVFEKTNYVFYMCRLNPLSRVKLRSCNGPWRERYEFRIKVPNKYGLGFKLIPLCFYVENGYYYDAITAKKLFHTLVPGRDPYIHTYQEVIPSNIARITERLDEDQLEAYEKGIDEFNSLIKKSYDMALEKENKRKARINEIKEDDSRAQVYLANLQRRRSNKNKKGLK